MKKMMWVFIGMLFLVTPPASAEIVTFDDLILDPESFYNGSDEAGEFETTGVVFNIFYDDEFGPYWEGFSYSNTMDMTTPDFTNQYSAITGIGADKFPGKAMFHNNGPVESLFRGNDTCVKH